jgi:multidrug resistance efflux pump
MRLKPKSQLEQVAEPVRAAVAAQRSTDDAPPVLSAAGYIIARNQVEVASKITGRIVSLEVKEGDFVKQGQVIARLDDYEVSAQVRQAQANLEAAQARLKQLEAGSRQQEIERAKAQMERAKADLNNAELNLQRAERLVKEGVLSQQLLDDARARHEIALKAYQAAKEDYDLVRIGPRQEEIDLARAQVQQAAAALAFAQAQLENTIIRAPVAGTILDRYVDLGEMVTTGFASERGARQALVSLADLNDLQVELDITEADIAKVQLDQPTIITPDAYPDRHYQGIVEYIAGVADRQKATIQTKVKVLNPDAFLRPDMGAQVSFYSGDRFKSVPQQRRRSK